MRADSDTSDQWERELPATTRRAIGLTALALGWERLWPRLALLAAIVGAFLAVAWLGLLALLPAFVRLGIAGAFAAAALLALIHLLRTPWPRRSEAVARLDREAGLAHRPLGALADRPALADDAAGAALWRAHRERLLLRVSAVRAAPPSPRLDRADPHALRAAVLIAVFVGYFATTDHLGPLAGAFRLPASAAADIRVDVWVTPPAYTGEAPRALVSTAPDGLTLPPAPVVVPTGSELAVRLAGIAAPAATFAVAGHAPASLDGLAPSAGEAAYRLRLSTGGELRLTGSGMPDITLPIGVKPDLPPRIALAEQPAATARGALRLAYEVSDDYRVAAAAARFALDGPEDARPLVALPELPLVLPRRGEARAVTSRDLTAHPLAGARVRLTLYARDDAGHNAETPPLDIDLPARPFVNPLAAAIVEQRRLLAEDAGRARDVAAAFETLGDLGAPFIGKAGELLGLRVARNRILIARDDDELRDVLDYLWQMALAIESGDLTSEEQRLAAAREALKAALEAGAPPEEIARLTEEMKAALGDYLRSKAEAAARNPGQLGELNRDPGGQSVTAADLQKLIDRIEELSRLGEHEAAAELLAQLDDILSGLQFAQPGAAAPRDPTLDELADIIRRQQDLQNRTHKLTPDGYTGEEFAEDGTDRQTLDDLARQQSRLAGRLAELMGKLQQGADGGQSDALAEAGRAMNDASGNLGQGDADAAAGEQGAAIEALRRGARQMARGEGQGGGQGARAGGTDPLGRPTGRRGPDFGDDTKIPGEIEVQRARKLLEELRRRYADPGRPPLELDYLRRLIAPF